MAAFPCTSLHIARTPASPPWARSPFRAREEDDSSRLSSTNALSRCPDSDFASSFPQEPPAHHCTDAVREGRYAASLLMLWDLSQHIPLPHAPSMQETPPGTPPPVPLRPDCGHGKTSPAQPLVLPTLPCMGGDGPKIYRGMCRKPEQPYLRPELCRPVPRRPASSLPANGHDPGDTTNLERPLHPSSSYRRDPESSRAASSLEED